MFLLKNRSKKSELYFLKCWTIFFNFAVKHKLPPPLSTLNLNVPPFIFFHYRSRFTGVPPTTHVTFFDIINLVPHPAPLCATHGALQRFFIVGKRFSVFKLRDDDKFCLLWLAPLFNYRVCSVITHVHKEKKLIIYRQKQSKLPRTQKGSTLLYKYLMHTKERNTENIICFYK